MKNKYKKVGKPKLSFTALLVTFDIFSGQSSIVQCTPSTIGPWDYIVTFNTTGGFTNIHIPLTSYSLSSSTAPMCP